MQQVLLCIQTGKTIHDPNRMEFANDEFYLKSTAEMQALFASVPEAITNTSQIAARCHVAFQLDGTLHLPKFRMDGVEDCQKLSCNCAAAVCDSGTVTRRRKKPWHA